MTNEYKDQLFENLKEYYKGRGFEFYKHYYERDEIHILLPDDVNVKEEFDKLYDILESLPDIDLPWERTRISYSHDRRGDWEYKLINPTEKDIYNSKLIAMGAGHYITFDEYKKTEYYK